MKRFGVEVLLKNIPCLDQEFMPIARFNRAFLESAKKPFSIAVERAEAKATAEKLEGIMLKMPASSGADGKLYGSITSKDIVEALAAQAGITIDKRKILSDEPIRTYGAYTREVKLFQDVIGKIHLTVCEKK